MRLVSPTHKIRCPFCRKEFHPSDCVILSSVNGTILYNPPAPRSFSYYFSRFHIDELSGPRYTAELARRACPSCRRALPEREIDEPVNIAIVGDTSSGKTHYIAVLIDQLKHGVLMQAGSGSIRLVSLSPETDRKYQDDYYIPILQNKNALNPGTARGTYTASGAPVPSDPLVYQLALRDHTGEMRNVNLLFYDISGEEIADSTLIVQFGEHILRADAIIYLADPVTMAAVRQKLPSHLQPDPKAISSRTAHQVLGNIMYRFEQYRKLRPGENVDIPTAILLSKSDLLKYTVPVHEHRNYLIFQPKVYDGRVYPQEFARINQEVVACLNAYGETSLLQTSNRFTHVNFFAASATGGPPDSNGRYIHLEPQRCLDPFLWALWKLGHIDAA